MATNNRITAQKARACAFHHAGMGEVEACEAAGYSRPDRAAARLFKRGQNGELVDDVIANELARLSGTGEHADALEDMLANVEIPTHDDPARAMLWTIARDVTAAPSSRVQALKALVPKQEYKHRDDMVEGEECPACGFVKGADGDNAADSIKRLLGIVA